MANKKYVMFDLDDEKLGILAEVLSNKTAKRIVEYLADKESSESEIGRDLNLAANTVNYNIKKLIESGLIEQSKDWRWSVKGKKVLKYRVANKKILISPKNKSNTGKNVLSALLATGVFALLVKLFTSNNGSSNVDSFNYVAPEVTKVAVDSANSASGIISDSGSGVAQAIQVSGFSQIPGVWLWFLLGGILALIIFMILNWRNFKNE